MRSVLARCHAVDDTEGEKHGQIRRDDVEAGTVLFAFAARSPGAHFSSRKVLPCGAEVHVWHPWYEVDLGSADHDASCSPLANLDTSGPAFKAGTALLCSRFLVLPS